MMMMMKLTHDDRKSDLAKMLRNAATILKQLSVHSQSKRSTPKDVRSSAQVVKKLLASARIASGGQYANELSQLEGHVDKIAQWPDNSQAGKIAAQLAARIASISGHMADPWAGDAAGTTQNGGIKMNAIKQKMNYHAREYRRLKAMDAGTNCRNSIAGAISAFQKAAVKCSARDASAASKLVAMSNDALSSASRKLQDAQRACRAATSLIDEAHSGDNAKLAKAASFIMDALAAL